MERLIRSINQSIKSHAERLTGEKDLKFPPLSKCPNPEWGDLSLPAGFILAKIMRNKPEKCAEKLAKILTISGVKSILVKGPYLNLFLDRNKFVDDAYICSTEQKNEKTIVEHTNINPNKAAHIGHLRNAVLGDTLARLLRFMGEKVEVHNYIDDTGVQVADIVIGLIYLEKKDVSFIKNYKGRFDDYCWKLYGTVEKWLEEDEKRKTLRTEILHKMETETGIEGEMASLIVERMVHAHLRTMKRVNIEYDLLPYESSILKKRFWEECFEAMKSNGAIRLERDGRNKGCWIMPLSDEGEFKNLTDADKVIVRSNGTVTYVGKDIAYQCWKFGLLKNDFSYQNLSDNLWVSAEDGVNNHPAFGHADHVINVIDVRQSYLQKIVKEGLKALGFNKQAENSIHFAYEMLALSKKAAEEIPGLVLSEEDMGKSFIEMSGRKGIGVQADTLIDILIDKAEAEIKKREPATDEKELKVRASQIAVGALRFYLLKFSRNTIIVFDFEEALSFEGETGPYIQYSVVRALNILRKAGESLDDVNLCNNLGKTGRENISLEILEFDEWNIILSLLLFPMNISQAIRTFDLSIPVKTLFEIAQSFSYFYHKYPVIQEEDADKKKARLFLVKYYARSMTFFLTTLFGIPVPEKM